ncbi:MAG: molybdate ABC transporter substrate-binding protein [Ilumatobacteraceae bacterium]
MTIVVRMRQMPRLLISSIALLGFVGASCGGSDSAATDAPTTVPAVSGDVVVFAASSLTEAFTEIGDAFKADNPDANVVFTFAGSGDLVTQIGEGAPADVFASADDTNMTKLTEAGESAGQPVAIAKNAMEIIVEKGNPKAITGVADLAKPDLLVVLCADTVPCGKSAAAVLENAAVSLTPVSLEDKVKGVVTKVSAGEADAGIVYVSDVNAVGDAAEGVEIPADINVVNNYPMVVTKEATNTAGAKAFVDYVASPAGQIILAKYGFLAP